MKVGFTAKFVLGSCAFKKLATDACVSVSFKLSRIFKVTHQQMQAI